MAELGEPAATAADRDSTHRQPLLDLAQPAEQVLQAELLLEPLRLAVVAPHPAAATTPRLPHADRQTRPQALDRAAQPHADIQQVGMGPRPLVARGAGDRPGPAAGRGCGQDALAVGALVGSPAEPATPGKVLPGQPAKVLSDHAQDLLVVGLQSQPGADPRPRRRRSDHRRRQGPHRPATPTLDRAHRSAFNARFRADRRPYSRAQKLVSTSTMSRTRSSVTPPSSTTTSRRPWADSAAPTNSAFRRARRSRCSTTTIVTVGSANRRRTLDRAPLVPDPTSVSTRTTGTPARPRRPPVGAFADGAILVRGLWRGTSRSLPPFGR
jgi:hypothetical protein